MTSKVRRLLGAALVVAGANAAGAETRTFIVANSPDGYGVDQCLADGADCGTVVARAYCQAQDFEGVVSFRRIERGEASAVTPVAESAGRGPAHRDAFVAIACSR